MTRTRSVSRLTDLLVKAVVLAALAGMLTHALHRVYSAAGRSAGAAEVSGRFADR